MALAKVQSKSQINGNAIPGTMTLSSAPTNGNLMILCVGLNVAVSSMTLNSAKWTMFDAQYSDDGASYAGVMLYRYASGETTTMPAPFTAGSSYSSYDFYEISGVGGTWDSDFQMSLGRHTVSNINGKAIAPFPLDNNVFALAFTTNYNGNINSSFGGSWTLDEQANNSGNFGSCASAHRSIASGNSVDGTWTTYAGSDSNPATAFLIFLADGALPSHTYVKQVYTRVPGSVTPGAVTVPWTPHNGDLMLGYISWSNGSAANPTIGGSWTQWDAQAGASTDMTIGLYRYVSGDTATLAAMATANAAYCTQSVVVIGGVTGTWGGGDHISDKSGYQASGASLTTTADTTTHANQFAIIHDNNYNGTAHETVSGSFIDLVNILNNASYGAFGIRYQFYATTSSSVQSTITAGSSNPLAYIQTIFGNGSTPSESGSAVMGFTGISFAGAGSDTHAATGNMAFSGIAFSAAGTEVIPTGSAAMAFPGISIVAAGVDLGTAPSTTNSATVSAAIKENLQPLAWNVPIVDKNTGFPSPELQRKWAQNFKIIQDQGKINTKILPKTYIDTSIASALNVAQGYATTAQAAAIATSEAYTAALVIPGIQLTSALPASPAINTRAVVSDATLNTFGSALAGSGTYTVPVVYVGSWIIG